MERPCDPAAQVHDRPANQARPLRPSELASCIDHTLLRRDASPAELHRACDEALRFGFRGVCVYPEHLEQVVSCLTGKALAITVAGFPGGLEVLEDKADQTRAAVASGAAEVDAVLNRDLLRQRDHARVLHEIATLVRAACPARLKIILETGDLTRDERIMAATLAKAAGAACVKTSTGLGHPGATAEDVALLRDVVGRDMGVKASGGIRDLQQCLAMLQAGASIIGTSASVTIMEQAMALGDPESLPGEVS
ncbi:MAG: deoxyribose-phosphate aldolase [Desulfocurvibacter africanus]